MCLACDLIVNCQRQVHFFNVNFQMTLSFQVLIIHSKSQLYIVYILNYYFIIACGELLKPILIVIKKVLFRLLHLHIIRTNKIKTLLKMQSSEKSTKILDLASLDPSTRVKQLANYGAIVEVDPNVPPRR